MISDLLESGGKVDHRIHAAPKGFCSCLVCGSKSKNNMRPKGDGLVRLSPVLLQLGE